MHRSALMNAIRNLVLAGMLVASNPAATMQASEPLLLHAGKATASIEVPAGWKVRTLEGRMSGSYPLVELTPASVSALDTPFLITIVYYKSREPIDPRMRWVVARARWEISEKFTDRGKVAGTRDWQLTEASGSVLNAYIPLGDDVAVVSLRAQGSGRYDEGKAVLLNILKSYKEVGTL
jgi:hypothetical protein